MEQVSPYTNPVRARFAGALLLCAALASAESILVLHPQGNDFAEAIKGIRENLEGFDVQDVVVSKDSPAGTVAQALASASPEAVVLMDNHSIRLFKEYQAALPDSAPRIPSIALMAVQVELAIGGIRNATGISYEVPAVTTIVNLRSLLQAPIGKVGVIYRASMESFFVKNAAFCKRENIELVGVKVADDADAKTALKNGLEQLNAGGGVDALWVLNDNFFLNVALLKSVWLPAAAKQRKPIVVGVESLIATSLNFGTFAVLPDPYGLGSQTANLIFDLKDNGWDASERGIDQPVSVVKILNAKLARKISKLNEDRLREVDKLAE